MHEPFLIFVAVVGNDLFVENLKGRILYGYLWSERTKQVSVYLFIQVHLWGNS